MCSSNNIDCVLIRQHRWKSILRRVPSCRMLSGYFIFSSKTDTADGGDGKLTAIICPELVRIQAEKKGQKLGEAKFICLGFHWL